VKSLFVILALLCVFSANSEESDWRVGAITSGGDRLIYQVHPDTVEIVIRPELVLYTVLVTMVNIDKDITDNKRLFVTGCEKGAGKVIAAEIDGTIIDGIPTFDWSKDGERVFDIMSVMTCAAYSLKHRNRLPETNTQPPTKQKPGLIV